MLALRANLFLLSVLCVAWVGLRTSSAQVADAAFSPRERAELSQIEDDFARSPQDVVLARTITSRYIAKGHPALAVAAVQSAHPELMEDAVLLHHLASAYERMGRVHDALDTSQLALMRCARSLGSSEAINGSPLPKYLCAERNYIAFDQHREALGRMVAWGVTDPIHDQRAQLAYHMAVRLARVEMASAE